MRLLRLTFLVFSVAPLGILALAFRPGADAYRMAAHVAYSLLTSAALTVAGFVWYMSSAQSAKPARGVAAATWLAAAPLLLAAVLLVYGLVRGLLV